MLVIFLAIMLLLALFLSGIKCRSMAYYLAATWRQRIASSYFHGGQHWAADAN